MTPAQQLCGASFRLTDACHQPLDKIARIAADLAEVMAGKASPAATQSVETFAAKCLAARDALAELHEAAIDLAMNEPGGEPLPQYPRK